MVLHQNTHLIELDQNIECVNVFILYNELIVKISTLDKIGLDKLDRNQNLDKNNKEEKIEKLEKLFENIGEKLIEKNQCNKRIQLIGQDI